MKQLDSYEQLRKAKRKYLYLLCVFFITNLLSRILPWEKSPIFSGLVGLVFLCLGVWYLVCTYRFTRALGYGVGSAIGWSVLSIIPMTYVFVMLALVWKYKKMTSPQDRTR